MIFNINNNKFNNIFITSDTHFNHDKDFIYKERGFNTIQEMNAAIVLNWNATVKPDDIVFHLGDVFMGATSQDILTLLKRLNGIKYLAFGNHDTDKKLKFFKENEIFEDIQMGYRIKYKKKIFLLTHYPTLVSNKTNDKVISLFGHTHQKDNFLYDLHNQSYMYHVGLDSHNNYPINLNQILEDIQKQKNNF